MNWLVAYRNSGVQCLAKNAASIYIRHLNKVIPHVIELGGEQLLDTDNKEYNHINTQYYILQQHCMYVISLHAIS